MALCTHPAAEGFSAVAGLRRQYKRDINCLEDSSRQCSLRALARLSALFQTRNNVSSQSPGSSASGSRSATRTPQQSMISEAECQTAPDNGSKNLLDSVSGTAETGGCSREDLFTFFLTDIYGPCLKLASDSKSDACREAAVNLIRMGIESAADPSDIAVFMSKKRLDFREARRTDAARESGSYASGQALVDSIHSRLSGHPFREPVEEIRGGLLLLLMSILRHSEPSLPRGNPEMHSGSPHDSIWPDNTAEDRNPYPVEGCEDTGVSEDLKHRQQGLNSEDAARKDEREERIPRGWQIRDDCADSLAQCATKALSDHDPHNKQLACRLVVLLAKCIRFDSLSQKTAEKLASTLTLSLRHPQRKVRWHVLDALQYLLSSVLLGCDCLDKVMTSVSSLVEDEVAPAIRYKICAFVGFLFFTLPVRYLQPHMAKLLAFLLACIAAEDDHVKSYGARVLRNIALPCLHQLREAKPSAVEGSRSRRKRTCEYVDACPFSWANASAESPAGSSWSALLRFMLSLAEGETEQVNKQVLCFLESAALPEESPGSQRESAGHPPALQRGPPTLSSALSRGKEVQVLSTRLLAETFEEKDISPAPSAMQVYLEVLKEVLSCVESIAILLPPPVWVAVAAKQMQLHPRMVAAYEEASETQSFEDAGCFTSLGSFTTAKRAQTAARHTPFSEETAGKSGEEEGSRASREQSRSAADAQERPSRASTASNRLYALLLLGRMLVTVDASKTGARARGEWRERDASFCVDLIDEVLQTALQGDGSAQRDCFETASAATEDARAFFAGNDTVRGSGGASDSKAADAHLAFVAVAAASVVTACRDSCPLRWPRLFAILLRLRVADSVPSRLVDTLIHLLSVYSGQAPHNMYCAYLAAFLEADQEPACRLNGASEPSSPESSLVAPWALSDPRRLILLHALQQLRVFSARSSVPGFSVDGLQGQSLSWEQTEEGLRASETAEEASARNAFTRGVTTGGVASPPILSSRAAATTFGEAGEGRKTEGERAHAEIQLTLKKTQNSEAQSQLNLDWVPGLLCVLKTQACPDTVAPAVRVDTLALLFELYANPELSSTCLKKYAPFVVGTLLLPNLRWRPGEANAKLRKAALACLAAVMDSLTGSAESEHSAGVAGPSSASCASSSSLSWTEDSSEDGGSEDLMFGIPKLDPQDGFATQTELGAGSPVPLLKPLLPCLLSCLEDDGQPDTRRLTADVLARLFSQLRGSLRFSSFGVSFACTSEAELFPSPPANRRTPPQRRECEQNASSPPSGRSQVVRGRRDRSYVALCSALYVALLQRLDDAREEVRCAAAQAICEMLLLLVEIEGDPEEDAAESRNASSERGEDDPVPSALGRDTCLDGESEGEDSTKGEGSGGLSARGETTSKDDKDEDLAATVTTAMKLAGHLDAELLRREVTAAVGQCLYTERYEALAEFAETLLEEKDAGLAHSVA
ncbi:HEAT repeat-containing protein [Toxoplasma gondii FOU]|uniref:HEAT repeat-containing protein n=1 Tax=Toxoplasma gondii FOU TaxID=943167 RepID=A0A086KXV7_TOXGO|nr:HEAT repeat-containing protein [Toxoplasma gondii FOU]